MNVGRNYNGPKVLNLAQVGLRRTGTVIEKGERFESLRNTIATYGAVMHY